MTALKHAKLKSIQIFRSKFDSSSFYNLALILDCSDSAHEAWHMIRADAQAIIRERPQLGLFFLGSNKKYPPLKFEKSADSWRSENQSHGSFIQPIIPFLNQYTSIVVLGSGRIFDLDDIEIKHQKKIWKFFSYSDSLLCNTNFGTEVRVKSSGNILPKIFGKKERIEILGKGFFPLHWNNSSYKLKYENENFSLVNDNPSDPSITIHHFGKNPIIIEHNSLGENEISLDSNPYEDIDKNEHIMLDPEDSDLLNKIIHREHILCPVCKNYHSAILFCQGKNMIIPQCIIKGLKERNGFFQYASQSQKDLKYYGSFILIGSQQVVFALDNKPKICRVHRDSNWIMTDMPEFFEHRPNEFLFYLGSKRVV